MNIFRRLRRLFSEPTETDFTFEIGRPALSSPIDSDPTSREESFAQALEAWRVNPLARQIVGLISQFIIGTGIQLHCEDETAATFLRNLWRHPLNDFDNRIVDWCDEFTRTGNLFILISTNSAGASFFRAVPASNIKEIETSKNDIEQPLFFHPNPDILELNPAPYKAYAYDADVQNADGSFDTVMVHFSINRPVGALWGESDLTPMLRWLSRYSAWLEDRARLNRFRNAFIYVVKGRFLSEADRLARQRALNAQPPSPGSILVAGDDETWEVIAPQLGSADASLDGLAIKKMISVGAGIPLHFLAEPESATRTTAEAADGPTFRKFAQRQKLLLSMLHTLFSIAARRRSMIDVSFPADARFSFSGPDISPRDNLNLAQATKYAFEAFYPLLEKDLISKPEFLRMLYRFAAEANPNESDGDIYAN